MTENLEQSAREQEAVTGWRKLTGFIPPLKRELQAAFNPAAEGRKSGLSKAQREMLSELPFDDLAGAVWRAVLNPLLGWEWDDEADEPEPRDEAELRKPRKVMFQALARRAGDRVLRMVLQHETPARTSQDEMIELEKRWSLRDRTTIGACCVSALHASQPNLLHMDPPRKQTGRGKHVKRDTRYTPALVSLTLFAYSLFEDLIPMVAHRPMVEPPKPWGGTPIERGGYRYALGGSVPLIRNVAAVDADPPRSELVYGALNRLQDTAWHINDRVLAVMQKLGLGELFPMSGAVTDQRHALLKEAAREKDAQRLYFVHSLDYRGRVYPVASYVSPQGPDEARALLEFADGCKIRPQDWAAIDALERYGKACRVANRQKREKRWQYLAFCIEHKALRKAHARGDTYESRLPIWQDAAQNGLQHMAWLCGDLALAQAVGVAGKYEFDGWVDAEGNEHYEGGRVNVQGVYRAVADAMTEVLQKSKHRNAQALLSRGEAGRVPRDWAKIPTMLFGYGAGKQTIQRRVAKKLGLKEAEQGLADTFADAAWKVLKTGLTKNAFKLRKWLAEGVGQQIQKWEEVEDALAALEVAKQRLKLKTAYQKLQQKQKELRKKLEAEPDKAKKKLLRQAHKVKLARGWKVYRALQGRLKKTAEYKAYWALQGTLRPAAWRVPETGFPAAQHHSTQVTEQRIVVHWKGMKDLRPRVPAGPLAGLRRNHWSSLPPNVIHSLDGAHLMLTVSELHAGIPIGTVHDAFATWATHASTLAKHFARGFVTLYYEKDVLTELYQQFLAQCQDITRPGTWARGELQDSLRSLADVGEGEIDEDLIADRIDEAGALTP